MDKTQEEFEVWFAETYPIGNLERNTEEVLRKMIASQAWEASRARLLIELPPMPKAQRTDEEATFSAGGCDMRRKCLKAIEAAGLKVKP